MCFYALPVEYAFVGAAGAAVSWLFESGFDSVIIFYRSAIFLFQVFPLFSLVSNFLFHSSFLQWPSCLICSPMRKARLAYSKHQNFTQIVQAHSSESYTFWYMTQQSSCMLPINYDSSIIFCWDSSPCFEVLSWFFRFPNFIFPFITSVLKLLPHTALFWLRCFSCFCDSWYCDHG